MAVLSLVMQRADLVEGKAPKSKPYNAKDLPPDGYALRNLVEEMPEIGNLLGVKREPLVKVLERIAFVRAMREAIEWCLPVIDTHEAHALCELAAIVDPTVEGVKSLLPRFPRMERILEDALIYKKGPSEQGVQTRGENAQVAAAAVEAERSKVTAAAAAAPPAPQPPVVVAPVVVPQVTPATAPQPASPPPKRR
jgi:hypothetical protein